VETTPNTKKSPFWTRHFIKIGSICHRNAYNLNYIKWNVIGILMLKNKIYISHSNKQRHKYFLGAGIKCNACLRYILETDQSCGLRD